MRRDFIIVVGMQGYGKSAWTMTYAAPKSRLFLYDPKAEYPRVNFQFTDEYFESILDNKEAAFRVGSFNDSDVPMLTSAAYSVGDCTLILEECKMLFDRGEDIAPWARPPIYMGREPKLNLVLCAQRMTAIPPDIRSQASRMVSFLQVEKSDVKAFEERAGEEGLADVIRHLDYLECVDWQAGLGVKHYSITYPAP